MSLASRVRRSGRAVFATPIMLSALAGCGQPVWDGNNPAACPALPLSVVAEVTQDLAADSQDPQKALDDPERGSLSEPGSEVLRYGCAWPSTEGEPGLQVSVEDTDPASAFDTTETLKRWTGPELTADDQGYGRAHDHNGRGEATWVCGDLTQIAPILRVKIFSPKEGTDPAVDAQRLAEAILEIVDC